MAEPADLEELASLYRRWEPEELVRAIGEEASTYSPEALALLRQELASRGLRPGQLEAAVSGPRAAERERLRGVRGFLALMVFDIGSRSLLSLFVVVRLLSAQPRRTEILLALLAAFMGLYGLLVCVLLVRRRPRAPREAAAWFALLLATCLVLVYSLWQDGSLRWPAAFLFYPALWLLYLWKSRRVKITFGPPPEPAPDLAAFD